MSRSPRARRTLVAIGVVAALAGFAWLGPPVCPTAFFLGIPCPGCGLTRATLAVLRGDFGAALRLHPLVFVLSPLLGLAIGATLVDYVRGGAADAPSRIGSWFSERARYGAAWGLLVVSFGVWGARFAGYFGGPVPVENFRAVAARWHGEH